jgi:hypothetical protein
MTRKMIILLSVMLLWATAVHASELGISFNDYSAQVAFRSQVGTYDSGTSVFGVRGLYNERRDTSLVAASFDVLGPVGNSGLEIGAGVNGYYIETKATENSVTDDVAAGGLGAIIRFTPPGLEKLSFTGRVYYCPEIFTGLDGDNLLETEARASFEIAPNARVFATYNEIKVDIENKDSRTIDDTFRVGLSLGF